MNDATRTFIPVKEGETRAADQLFPLVYDELRRLAAYRLARERPGQTLEATALVNEAYLRLVGPAGDRRWDSRGHFFAAAAQAMRHSWWRTPVARGARSTAADGVASTRTSTPSAAGRRRRSWPCTMPCEAFAVHDPVKAKLVELRFFGGLTLEQAAACLEISRRRPTGPGGMPAPGCTPPWPTRIPGRREAGPDVFRRPRRMNVRGETACSERRARTILHGGNGASDWTEVTVSGDLESPASSTGMPAPALRSPRGRFSRGDRGRPDRRRPAPRRIDRSPTGSRSATGHDAKKVPPTGCP